MDGSARFPKQFQSGGAIPVAARKNSRQTAFQQCEFGMDLRRIFAKLSVR
jgi:hypothetical protein